MQKLRSKFRLSTLLLFVTSFAFLTLLITERIRHKTQVESLQTQTNAQADLLKDAAKWLESERNRNLADRNITAATLVEIRLKKIQDLIAK